MGSIPDCSRMHDIDDNMEFIYRYNDSDTAASRSDQSHISMATTDSMFLDANATHWHPNSTTESSSLIAGLSREQVDPDVLFFRKVVHLLDLYLVPAVAVIGLLGNTVSFLVFVGTYLRRMSSSIYLAGLTLSDNLFLLVMLISWANNVGWDIHHRTGWCQLFVYLAYISSFLSVWYVVSFTLERYLAVKFPLKRQTMCTPGRARNVVVSLAALSGILYSYSLWTSGLVEMYRRPFCFVLPRFYHTVHVISTVDTFVTLIIPTVLIIAGNTQIVYALTTFYRSRSRLQFIEGAPSPPGGADSSNSSADGGVNFYANTSYNRLQMKVTKMLLIVSTVFLLCNIPSHAIRVYAFAVSMVDPAYKPSHCFLLIQKLAQFLFYINFATNFVLYSLSGKIFRKATALIATRARQKTSNFFRVKYSMLRSKSRSRSTRSDIQRARVSGEPENRCLHHVTKGGQACKVCEKYS